MVQDWRTRVAALYSRADAALTHSARAAWLAVFVPVLLLYLITLRTDGATMISDTVSVTPTAWQLAHTGSPRIPVGTPTWDAWLIPSSQGHVISNREPGLIGLAAIFYLIMPWTSISDVMPASLAASLVTAAAVATLGLVARRLLSPAAAVTAALVAGTATATWPVSGTSLFPHGPDQLYIAIALLAVAATRFAWAGFAYGLAILTRPPLGVAAAVIGMWHTIRKRSPWPALAVAVPAALGLGVFLWYSARFWGGGLQSQYMAANNGDFSGRFLDIRPRAWADLFGNVVGTLVSPGRGILIGSPFLIVLAFGIRPAWRAAPSWVRSAAIAGLTYLFVQLKANRFQGGAPYWGYRYPLETLTLLFPLFVLAFREYVLTTNRRRATFAALTVFAVSWQAVGAFCFRTNGPKGTVVWLFTDLQQAISDHPIASVTLLAVGYLLAAVVFRLIDVPRDPIVRAPQTRDRGQDRQVLGDPLEQHRTRQQRRGRKQPPPITARGPTGEHDRTADPRG